MENIVGLTYKLWLRKSEIQNQRFEGRSTKYTVIKERHFDMSLVLHQEWVKN